jgi:hypothetical protein
MHSHEIAPDRRAQFIRSFSARHLGWPVTIELLLDEAGPQRLSDELPLLGLSFDTTGTHPSTLDISAGDRPDVHVQHSIELPLHIYLAEDDADGSGTLEVEPALGPQMLVHFHRPH